MSTFSDPSRSQQRAPPDQLSVPATVLVVDDHQANLASLEVVLTELGYVSLLANSGAEALKYLLEEENISCVLLDVRMPVIDGFETAALIRKRERQKDLPIIFMTSTQPTLLDFTQGYSLGAVDFISRPIDAEVLKGKVKAITQLYLGRERARRERDASSRDSRERLALLFDELPVALWSADENLVVTYCGGALYGRGDLPACETFIGKSLSEILKPSGGAEHPGLAAHLQALAGRTTAYEEETGGRILEGHVRPLRDEAGRIRGVMGIAVDITGRRDAEERRRQEATRLSLVTDAVPALISYIDSEGRYVFVNQGYEEWFGQPREEAPGKHLREVLGEAAYARVRGYVEEALSGKKLTYEAEVPYQYGGTRFVRASYVPHVVEGGRVAGFVALITDITDLRRREEAQAFLAQAGAALSSSLDPRVTLDTMAQLAVPRMADWCAIDLLSKEGSVERVAMVHPDPTKVARASEYMKARPVSLDEPHGIGAVLRTGEPELVPWIPDLADQVGDWHPEDARLITDLGLRSVLIVPLPGRERTLGAISFLSAESGRRYAPEDLSLAQDLAKRAALALENAFLYDRVQSLNATLTALIRDRTVALADSVGRYNVLSKMSPVGIFRTGASGDCLEVNQRWTEITGLGPAEALGLGWVSALHPLDRERIQAEWYGAARERRPFASEYRFLRPDGSVTWVLGQAVELLSGSGEVSGYVGTVTDITERKAREEEIRVAADRLEAANQELEAFVRTVAHDLRAPLRSMVRTGQMLLEDYAGRPLDPEGRAHAQRIVDAGLRLDRMTRDLLSYAYVAQSELVPEALEMGPILEEVLAEMEPDLVAKKARVRRGDFPAPLLGTKLLVKQVLSNLIYNAVKFVAPGVEPDVRVFGELRGDRVRIWVEDNGIGVAPEDTPKLFRLFERLHSRDVYPGTGVGLALVKRGIERLGGQVGVETEPGRGSQFWFELRRS